jgi:hypothetical protein
MTTANDTCVDHDLASQSLTERTLSLKAESSASACGDQGHALPTPPPWRRTKEQHPSPQLSLTKTNLHGKGRRAGPLVWMRTVVQPAARTRN